MKDEEIKALMNKYTEAMNPPGLIGEGDNDEAEINKFRDAEGNFKKFDYVDFKRHEAHKIGIEVLDKILTPELKILVMNLCLDRIGYPEDPEFYRIFGLYPKVGDKVREASLREKGISGAIDSFEPWAAEGAFVEKKEIDGETYYVITGLDETKEGDANQKLEILKLSQILSEIKKKNSSISLTQDEWKLIDEIETKAPLISGLHI